MSVGDGDAAMASAALDAMRPFIGQRKDSTQEHAFPRSINPDGSENTASGPPDIVLDLVSFKAARIATNDAPAVVSWSRSSVSETYTSPMPSKLERREIAAMAALQDYLLYSGRTYESISYTDA